MPPKPPAKPAAKAPAPADVARLKASVKAQPQRRGLRVQTSDEFAKMKRAESAEPKPSIQETRAKDRGMRIGKVLKSQYTRDRQAESPSGPNSKASEKMRSLRESSGMDYNMRKASMLTMDREEAGRNAVKASDAKMTKAAKKVYRPSSGDMRGLLMGGGGTSKNK